MIVMGALAVLSASGLVTSATATTSPTSAHTTTSGDVATSAPQMQPMNRVQRTRKITRKGKVLNGVNFRGRLVVAADRVEIKNSRVRGVIVVRGDHVKIRKTKVKAGGRQGIRVTRRADDTRILRSRVACTSSSTNGIAPGNYVARAVRVNGCRRAFVFSKKNPAKIRKSWVDGKPYSNRRKGEQPTYRGWPTPDTTGPREASRRTLGDLSSSSAGQVISRVEVNGRLTIRHDNVTVRDVTINGDGTYMLYVTDKANGSCPTGVRVEYTEINGANAAENDIPIYMDCGAVFDHGYVHNVGRTSRLTDNGTVSNSYVFSNRTGDSGAHRGAVGTNGGSNNKIINNVLMCEGRGCSAAIPMYGDFAPVDGMLVERNLLATTGSYCAYGGSVSSKRYPDGSNVRFIDNHFSTRFFDTCGRYGTVASFDNGVRGNEWSGNVWHESGRPVRAPN